MNINICDVFPPSDRQLSAGIHGTVNLEVIGDNGHAIVRLNGISIRKNSKDGSRFFAEPSYKVEKDGTTKYWSHFKVYPGKKDDQSYNESQRAQSDALITEVLRVLDDGGTRADKGTTAPKTVASTTSKDSEPWD